MEIKICPSLEDASRRAARLVTQAIVKKPDLVLGIATGSSPMALYQELVRRHKEERVSFRQTRFFGLDEYIGLPPTHPACYHVYVREHLASHLDIPESHVEVPRGYVADLYAECARYEQAIKAAGGIDIQILGIGTDGHIAFNEPSSSLGSRTRVKTLAEHTVRDNAVHFPKGEHVPEQVITMGIGTILDARHLIMLAFGESKRAIIAQALEGPLTAMVPASSLQLHPQVTVFLDEAAAGGLVLKEYYRRVTQKNEHLE